MLKISYFNTENNNINDDKLNKAMDLLIDDVNSESDYFKIFSDKLVRKQLTEFDSHADYIKKTYKHLVVIAMGGSVLNPESLITLNSKRNNSDVKVHFLHNTDPIYFEELFAGLDLKETALLATSNSGQTLETNALVAASIAKFQQHNITDFNKRLFFITKKNEGILHDVGAEISATIIEHMQDISGRYSSLTNVCTMAAMVAGVDVDSYLDGAKLAIEDFKTQKNSSVSAVAAQNIFNSNHQLMINIGYLQQFSGYMEWYSQIISESLGKEGRGITPVRGLGPNDQHSMLQLYLEGPRDKFYSLFYVENIEHDIVTADIKSFGNMADKSLEYINKANFEATCKALSKQGLPVRKIMMQDLSAKSIGYLTACSMLEVILIGYLMEINPFNQPGVELIKVESRKLMSIYC